LPKPVPRKVEYSRAPLASSFVTKALSSSSLKVVSKAPGVVGKSVEVVAPVTEALPAPSTARPRPAS